MTSSKRSIRMVDSTTLSCPKCGMKQTIYRKKSKLKQIGHIKDLWCPVCMEVTKYVELGSYSTNDI